MESLQSLWLTSNRFSSAIPTSIGLLKNLKTAYFEENEFSGPIPSEFGHLSGLEQLAVWRNQLSSSLPPQLGMCHLLETLAAGENALTGSVPPEIVGLPSLQTLAIFDNQLSGLFPFVNASRSLDVVTFHLNNLSGTIPRNIGEFTNLEILSFGGNALMAGTLPTGKLLIIFNFTLGTTVVVLVVLHGKVLISFCSCRAWPTDKHHRNWIL